MECFGHEYSGASYCNLSFNIIVIVIIIVISANEPTFFSITIFVTILVAIIATVAITARITISITTPIAMHNFAANM
jgi:hypothetical protein